MDVEFEDDDLDRLETDVRFDRGLPLGAVKEFRKAMQAIRAAVDERDLYPLRGLRLKKMKGDREGYYSLRCNDQYRLIVRFDAEGQHRKVMVIEVLDYH